MCRPVASPVRLEEPCDELQDPELSEIMVNGADRAFVEGTGLPTELEGPTDRGRRAGRRFGRSPRTWRGCLLRSSRSISTTSTNIASHRWNVSVAHSWTTQTVHSCGGLASPRCRPGAPALGPWRGRCPMHAFCEMPAKRRPVVLSTIGGNSMPRPSVGRLTGSRSIECGQTSIQPRRK